MRMLPEDVGVLTHILAEILEMPPALVLEGGYGPSHGKAIRAIFRAIQMKEAPQAKEYPGRFQDSTSQLVNRLEEIHYLK